MWLDVWFCRHQATYAVYICYLFTRNNISWYIVVHRHNVLDLLAFSRLYIIDNFSIPTSVSFPSPNVCQKTCQPTSFPVILSLFYLHDFTLPFRLHITLYRSLSLPFFFLSCFFTVLNICILYLFVLYSSSSPILYFIPSFFHHDPSFILMFSLSYSSGSLSYPYLRLIFILSHSLLPSLYHYPSIIWIIFLLFLTFWQQYQFIPVMCLCMITFQFSSSSILNALPSFLLFLPSSTTNQPNHPNSSFLPGFSN